jgi:hypothetical protein
MPTRHAIDKERRLVISTGSEQLTFSQVKTHQDQLLNDPDFDPEFNQLIDLTAVTSLDISVDEAKIIASRKLFSSTSRRAFVASSPSIFGMGRMMEVYNEMSNVASRVRIFYDLPSAVEWLGLDRLP